MNHNSASISLASINEDFIQTGTKEINEPSWLSEMRRKAFSQYVALPSEVSPLYTKYSGISLLKPDSIQLASTNPADIIKPNDDLKDRLKELREGTGALQIGSAQSMMFVTDTVSRQGVIICDIRVAVAKFEELVKEYLFANPLNYSEDKFLALEASAFRSGVFIHIPKNTVVEYPIRIVTSLGEDGISLINRNIVGIGEGSKATVVQELYAPDVTNLDRVGDDHQRQPAHERHQDQNGILDQNQNHDQNSQQAYFELFETHVGANSHLEVVTLQAMGGDSTLNISNKKAFVERDAKMSWYIGMFGSQLSRCKTDSIMKGSGSSAEDVQIIFGIRNQSFDITSNLLHWGTNSRGRVLVKSVLKDSSKSLFKGMIKIGKDARGTESYLAGHAILLDKGSKSDSIPGLEIETNEVKATHSASVAQIDENQIFYLMTRGLSREGAKREIVNGFLEPLSRRMAPTIRAWINYLIENKWLGSPLMLRTDEAMEQILEVEKSRYRETQDLFEKHYKYR